MSAFAERFTELHEQLRADYSLSDGQMADCNQIAIELEELLFDGEIRPVPMIILGRPVDENTFSRITPRPYEGRLQWTCHIVCVSAGVVYDPMLPEPISLDLYPEAAFIEEVKAHPITG